MHKTTLILTWTCALAATAFATPAHAHIVMKGALLSRGGDQKMFPCDGKRGDGPVYTFAPGTTVTLSIDEQIPHPSYFRIAFDNDGDDDFVEPKSIKPIEASRQCPYDANDKCGAADYCNVEKPDGAGVLWDNLNPHVASAAKSLTWNVKLPDIECDNCTIQVIQVMEDTVHGAYCPSDSCKDTSLEDLYHRCIDIKLVKGATNGPGATTMPEQNMGMQCTSGATPGGMAGAGGASAGSGSAVAGSGSAVAGSGATMAGSGGTLGRAGAPAAVGAGGAGTSVAGSSSPADAAGHVATSVAGASAGSPAGSAPITGTAGSSGSTTGSAAGTKAAAPPTATHSGCSAFPRQERSSQAATAFALAFGLAAFRRRLRRGARTQAKRLSS
jgi:hypothetical protein